MQTYITRAGTLGLGTHERLSLSLTLPTLSSKLLLAAACVLCPPPLSPHSSSHLRLGQSPVFHDHERSGTRATIVKNHGAFRIDGMTAKMGIVMILVSSCLISASLAYDPKDEMLKDILLPEGQFEAFYLKGPQSEEENAARPPHLHGSFNKYRNPALVGAPNSAAYGFRFDGKRRFNYD